MNASVVADMPSLEMSSRAADNAERRRCTRTYYRFPSCMPWSGEKSMHESMHESMHMGTASAARPPIRYAHLCGPACVLTDPGSECRFQSSRERKIFYGKHRRPSCAAFSRCFYAAGRILCFCKHSNVGRRAIGRRPGGKSRHDCPFRASKREADSQRCPKQCKSPQDPSGNQKNAR